MSDSRYNRVESVGQTSGLSMFSIMIAVLIVELVALSIGYKNLLVFDCRSTGFEELCLSISDTPVRAIAVFGVFAIFLMTRPKVIHGLLSEQRDSLSLPWLLTHIIGLVIILIPLLFLNNSVTDQAFFVMLGVWIIGAIAASIGAVLSVFDIAAIRNLFQSAGLVMVGAIAAALVAPELTQLLQYAWAWQPVTDATFNSVASILRLVGIELHTIPDLKEIGIGEFVVRVGDACSGLEGVALICIFVTLYIVLFRDRINMKRALLLFPIGIMASLILNVVRITVLILIGANYSPELAINGFHSHAGWFFFMILALSLAYFANSIDWFHKKIPIANQSQSNSAATVPFAEDPMVALILPFIVFMLSTLLTDMLSETPALLYPLRALAMLGVLFYCRRYIASVLWRIEPIAVGAGVLIAVLWLVMSTAEQPDWQASLEALPASIFLIWVLARVVGTTFLVPIIEEFFFRGYLLKQFMNQSNLMLIVGIALSTGIFAALHGQWVLAIIAGLIFAGLYLRRERIADPIVAHMVANGIIAGAALINQNWALI